MRYRTTADSLNYAFPDLKTVLAKASPARSGDHLAGVAADSAEERMAARIVLADLPLAVFLDEAVIPYENDEAGDAVIGVNPASDSLSALTRLWQLMDEVRQHFAIPTQSCVLTHVTNQIAATERGAPVDLVFQSVAGTEQANTGFGIDLALLREARQAALALGRGTVGDNVMYLETGQGSALSAGAHHGVDQQTCEARAYAVARELKPLLVNTVVGFIGPEYLYDGKEIIRAGLEDHFCGKLMGVPMGCDICYTNHAEADQDDMDTLLTLLGTAGVTFIMGVPGADDVMLNYQSTSFHDGVYLREVLGLQRAPEFEAWLAQMRIIDAQGRLGTVDGSHALMRQLPNLGGRG